MKVFTFSLLTCLLLHSCKKDPDLMIDYCGTGIAEFKKDTVYKGTILFCNAQPPLMSFIPGIATANFIGPDTMQIRLVADSIHFDTTFLYLIKCHVAEEIYPLISLVGETANDEGYYTDGIRFITFRFGYPNCLTNTGFEGKSIR